MLEKENNEKINLERQIYNANSSVKATAKIMKEGKYTFNVLFDNVNPKTKAQNMVFSSMDKINHSMAIPRKMILKDGYVRYTVEGYGGSPSKLVDEIAGLPFRFIVFIDDLSFSCQDDSFAALKAVLEGGLADDRRGCRCDRCRSGG